MTKQKPVTLNLTKQEAECLLMLVTNWADGYDLNIRNVKPLRPFINRIKEKIKAVNQ